VWLAASPDNQVYDPMATPTSGHVEYKNPFAARMMTVQKACAAKNNFAYRK